MYTRRWIPYARRWIPILGLIGLLFATLAVARPVPALATAAATEHGEDANKATIKRLYAEALNGRDVDLLDELYASDYTEHSEALMGGLEVVKETFQGNFDQFPDAIWEIKHMGAEDDLVWVHAQINPTGEKGNEMVGLALIEIYRLDDGRIVEHWEAQQAIPEKTVSGHTMFEEVTEAMTEPVSAAEMARNKEIIRQLWTEFFNPPHDFDILPAIYGDNHIEHNVNEPDGLDGFIEIFKGLFEQQPSFGAEILLLSADGPYVWLYNQPILDINAAENPLAGGKGADLYKMKDGKIIEHWDVIQLPPQAAAETTETAAATEHDANKATIKRLYDEALNGRDVDLLDELYASDYTEHSEALMGGLEVVKETFQGNFDQFPDAIWEIKHMGAEDDLVWVHAQINPTGEKGNEMVGLALIEIYRLDDGRIVEHWEAQQAIPEKTVSGHTMFEEVTEAMTEPVSAAEMARNKEIIRQLWTEFFNPPHDFDILPAIYGDNHIEHNVNEPDGLDGFIEIFKGLFEQQPSFGAEILLLSADGPYVWLYNQPILDINAAENPLAGGKGADLYKMKDGKIIEHWDVIQLPPQAAAETAQAPDPLEAGPYAVGIMTNFVKDFDQSFDEWGGQYKGDAYRAFLKQMEEAGEPRTVLTDICYPTAPAEGASVESNVFPAPLLPAAEGRPATWMDYVWGDEDLFQQFAMNFIGFGAQGLVTESGQTLAELQQGDQNVFFQTVGPLMQEFASRQRNSYIGAPIAEGKFPLVIMAHGLGGSRLTWGLSCEQLASHGYIVVTVQFISDSSLAFVFHDPNSPFAQQATPAEIQAAYQQVMTQPPVFPKFFEFLYNEELSGESEGQPNTAAFTAAPDGAAKMTTMMAQLFQQRTNDVAAVINEMKALNLPAEECRTQLEVNGVVKDICGFFSNHVDTEHIGMMGHSLGSITSQVAAVQLPDIKTGIGFNNGIPKKWEPAPGFPNVNGSPEQPDGVPKDFLFLIGSDDSFVHFVFRQLFYTWYEAAGGDPTAIFPLPSEQGMPTADNPQPIARNAYERATGNKMLVVAKDQGHGTMVDDELDSYFPMWKLEAGEALVGYNAMGTRVPLEDDALDMTFVPDQFPLTSWVTEGEGDDATYTHIPQQMRNYYITSWFGWQLKGIESYRNGLSTHPFGEHIQAIHEEGVSVQAAPAMPEATMTKLDDGVYHYFGSFYSSLVVVTDDGVLITDPSNAARGQMLKAAIAELTDQPVTHIVLTHEHYDHTGGTEVFPDAQVICHHSCAYVFQLDEYGFVPDEVDISFESYLPIELGDTMVELHHLGPGDGMATTIIYMPKEQVVMSADLYEPRALTSALFMDDKNPLGVRKILNEVASWDLKHAINGHSPGTDPQDLREAAVYYEDLYQAVNAVLQPIVEQSGAGAAFGVLGTLHEQISLPQYEDWGEYDSSFAKHVFRMAMSLIHGG